VNLEIDIQSERDYDLIQIKGEVDLYSSPSVRKIILELTKKRSPAIFVDLGEVNYMDSSGVATMIEGLQLCNKYDGVFALLGLRENVREVFELTRLDKIFTIHQDLESALGAKTK